jgi:predicted DsbA family dithiol-disulfide isomerase
VLTVEKDVDDRGSSTDEDPRDPEEPVEAEAPGEPSAEPAGEAQAAGDTPTEGERGEDTPDEMEAEPATEQPAEGLGSNLRVALVSGAVLLFALAFFMAGFFVHAQMDDDEGGGGETSANASDDPFWGPENAQVVIEEYADFQCPYCSQFAQETLPRLRQAYGDKVKFIYRDFPLSSIHPNAQKAAEAAQCAQEQDIFWGYHDILFQNTDALSVSDLKGYAQTLGANMDEFNECLDSEKNTWEVLLDTRDGSGAGVSGTPAFVVNGLLLSGVRPFEQFEAIIDSALKSGGG